MAAENGRTDTPLERLLFEEPYRFNFFQAVRLLERMYPERQPVGRHDDPSQELVRFRTRVSLNFPASEIHELTRSGSLEEHLPPRMEVAFMGMTGPLGVLPHRYTELLLERMRYRDTALREFLDLFSHRMISLFYRAWEKYRFGVAYERGGQDRFTEYLFDLVGLGTGGLRRRMSLEDEGVLPYGGLVGQRPHSSSTFEAILGDYFEVPVRVSQFVGQWLDIDEGSLSRLGNANSELGINAVAGSRFWDNQSKFRLVLGPLTFAKFRMFLPSGSAFKPVADLARFLAGMEFDFDVQLILKAEEVPACRLTTSGDDQPLLGWTTWLKTREFTQDDSQVVLPDRS
jgi:type VI secretion system protein ImpH